MNFAKDFSEKLRSQISISDIISKKVRLKKQGKNFIGLCPFHNEKSPSFSVNEQKGFYHCFGCHAHGDIITFTMETEGLQFKDAVIKLAEEYRIEIPFVQNNLTTQNYIIRDFEIAEKIAQFFHKNLYSTNAVEAQNYLKKRGFNSEICKKFMIGFAPKSYELLTNYLRELGFTDKEIADCGVIGKNDNGKIYDKFRNRITFVITDKKNRPIAFGGRSLGDEMPKYLNSAETNIFKKNLTLYNYFLAKKSIFEKGFALLVEGYVDTISLAINGFENTVAGLGTALGNEHLQQLFTITDKIILCLDGDKAGFNAMKRITEIALPIINSKKNIFFVFLPEQLDPDDFIKKYGKMEFQKLLDTATPLSQALIDFTIHDLNFKNSSRLLAEEKARLEMELNQKINLIIDPATKKYFNQFIKDWMFQNSRKTSKNIFSQPTKALLLSNKKLNNFNKNSLTILALLIKFPQLVNYRDNDFDLRELSFEDEKISELKEFIINLIDENCQNIIESLDKSDFNIYNLEIKNILASPQSNDINLNKKFRLLLLKDLFTNLERQCKENLNNAEIYIYKNSVESQIFDLQKDLLNSL
jgi:DNA primase